MDTEPQIAYCFDDGFFYPSLISIYSLLKASKPPISIHVFGMDLKEFQWKAIKQVITQLGGTVIVHKISKSDYKLPSSKMEHISPAAFLRLRLSDFFDKKVIYIDGDTLIVSDINELWQFDLQDQMIGASRSAHFIKLYTVLEKYKNDKKARRIERLSKIKNEIKDLEGFIGKDRAKDYINSGVILFDFEKIKANPKHHERFKDLEEVVDYSDSNDQVHCFRVFKDDITYLPLSWNSQHRAVHNMRSELGGEELDQWTQARKHPNIIHYNGPQKPWEKLRKSFDRRRFSRFWVYRKTMFGFRREFGGKIDYK